MSNSQSQPTPVVHWGPTSAVAEAVASQSESHLLETFKQGEAQGWGQ